MTLSSQQTKVVYQPDGQTFTFTVPFPVFAAGDLECIGVSAAGAETRLTDFTVQGLVPGAQSSNVSVTFAAAPGADLKLVIRRNTARVQESDYPTAGRFPAKTVERDFDRITGMIQELNEYVDRSMKVDAGRDEAPSAAEFYAQLEQRLDAADAAKAAAQAAEAAALQCQEQSCICAGEAQDSADAAAGFAQDAAAAAGLQFMTDDTAGIAIPDGVSVRMKEGGAPGEFEAVPAAAPTAATPGRAGTVTPGGEVPQLLSADIDIYWDNVNGDDARDGLSSSTARKSAQAVAGLANSFCPGLYQIRLHCLPGAAGYGNITVGPVKNQESELPFNNRLVLVGASGVTFGAIAIKAQGLVLEGPGPIACSFFGIYGGGHAALAAGAGLTVSGSIDVQGGGRLTLGTGAISCAVMNVSGGGCILFESAAVNVSGSVYVEGGGLINFANATAVNAAGCYVVYGGEIYKNGRPGTCPNPGYSYPTA